MGVFIGESRWIRVGLLVAAFLILRWPIETALGAFVLLVPFDSLAMADSGSGRTILWFVGVGAACTLLAAALVKSRLQRPPRAAFWWTIFVLWCVLTSVWAISPDKAWGAVPTALAPLILYLAAVSFRVEEREYKRIAAFIITGGTAAGFYAIRLFYQGVWFREATGTTMRGSLIMGDAEVNPNVFATRLLLPLALAVGGYLASRSRIVKLICLGASGTLILALLVTMSRGAFLAMLVMATVFAIRLGVNRRTLLVGATICGIIMAMPALFFSRLLEAGQTGGAGRLDIWHVAWQLIKHYSLMGAGLSNFPNAYTLYAGYAPLFRGFERDPHNVYLRVLVEFGILGTLLFAKVIWVELFRKPGARAKGKIQRNPWWVACEAAAWAIMTSAMFGNLLWEKSFWLVWMMLAFSTQLYGSRSFQSDIALNPVEVTRRPPRWSETLAR